MRFCFARLKGGVPSGRVERQSIAFYGLRAFQMNGWAWCGYSLALCSGAEVTLSGANVLMFLNQ